MRVVRDPREMQRLSRDLFRQGETIGFVPTMGALHEGHLSLLDAVRRRCSTSVMSIFVNPTQFGPREDLSRYPRPFGRDCHLAETRGCDIMYAPGKDTVYPEGFQTWVTVDKLTARLEGAARPDHFRGVTTVVAKLLNTVSPDVAAFGQKDAQQAVVVRRMIDDLDIGVEIVVCPTVRENDGLALSSRNAYLVDEERTAVPLIYAGLRAVADRNAAGERSSASLLDLLVAVYDRSAAFELEYAAIVDVATLEPLDHVEGVTLVAVACRTSVTRTRLIDNLVLGGSL